MADVLPDDDVLKIADDVPMRVEAVDIVSVPAADTKEAMKEYCSRFGQQDPNEFLGFNRKCFPWGAVIGETGRKIGEEQVQAELEKEMGLKHGAISGKEPEVSKTRAPVFKVKGWVEDSDGEDVRICVHCNLPLGDRVYNRGRNTVHGECMAQLMVQDLRSEEKARIQNDRRKKNKQHAAYDIGWKPIYIPRNDEAASKLAMRDVPQGMVCLVLDEESQSIRVASTMEPSAALNLEYLSTALQVRRREGHEPIFSLDPVTPDDKNSMQEKVFVPAWLAGTSAGEVLFQSDYHLKELSMGEFEQPVVGMKSCFDYSMIDDIHGWRAREWFLVRKAEVQISEMNMLIPMVKMGVEAREQVVKGNSLKDVPCTRPDHPMVKYAEAFTQNFDLIAERKSVVFHLRELAKASVMAKYLLDANIKLDSSWFSLAAGKEGICSLEVPQLWNERNYSKVHLKDGSMGRDQGMECHGVYGGVRFGLDKFNLSASVQPGRASAGVQASMPQHRLAFGLSRKAGVAPVQNIMSLASGAQFAGPAAGLSGTRPLAPSRLGAALSAASIGAPRLSALQGSVAGFMPGAPRLQGVDLRLDNFDLSEAKRTSLEAQAGSWRVHVKSLDECVAVGATFFDCLDGRTKLFKDDDLLFLRKVFNESLSDRRCEGDLFVPPDASHSYVHKLRTLVKEEEAVRQRRMQAFYNESFSMTNPGPLFPHSWSTNFEIVRGGESVQEGNPPGILIPRPEYIGQSVALLEHLRASAPVMDKSTEEGLRFRIYRLGSLEVRTTQEPEGDEITGAVFSIRNQSAKTSRSQSILLAGSVPEKEKITKATEYVERVCVLGGDESLRRRFFLVLETESGNKIVTERLSEGQLAWRANPDDLEVRSSLAKVTRSETCETGVTVHDMMNYRAKLAEGVIPSSKRYVQGVFMRAAGSKRNARSQLKLDLSMVFPECLKA